MTNTEFKKRAFIALIEATENPMAPIIMENAANAIEPLAKMLAAKAD